jgi:hypothetical protein
MLELILAIVTISASKANSIYLVKGSQLIFRVVNP